MKFSTILLTIMMIGLTFLIVELFIQDLKGNYEEITVNSTFSDKHDYSSRIVTQVEPLEEKLDKIEDADTGWKIFGAGLVVIPTLITTFITVVFGSLGILTSIVTSFGTILNIPPVVLAIISAMLLVFLIFKLIGWWQGRDT